MKEIIAYEMVFKGVLTYSNNIDCTPFREEYWSEYMQIYNECFYEIPNPQNSNIKSIVL